MAKKTSHTITRVNIDVFIANFVPAHSIVTMVNIDVFFANYVLAHNIVPFTVWS